MILIFLVQGVDLQFILSRPMYEDPWHLALIYSQRSPKFRKEISLWVSANKKYLSLGSTTMENSMEVPQKIKSGIAL